MRKLNVPSLQHLARNWHAEPREITKSLVRLHDSPPTFSYGPVYDLVSDLLILNTPIAEVMRAVQERVKRPSVRDNFLELLPLIDGYFRSVSPTFVHRMAGRQYPVARDLMVPFAPPLVYGANGETCFPWFSFWRVSPLSGDRLSLFVSVIRELLLQDPDLEAAKFVILDLSATRAGQPRRLEVIDSRDVGVLSSARLREMLDVFAIGYRNAVEELQNRPFVGEALPDNQPKPSTGQGELFTEP